MNYKVGDVVKIIANINHHGFKIGTKVRITEVSATDYKVYDLANEDYWFIDDKECELVKNINMDFKKLKTSWTEEVAMELLKANNTVTTLEVKTELRTRYPDLNWVQDEVHDFFEQKLEEGIFHVVDDNGTYRTWSLVKPTNMKTKTSLPRAIAELKTNTMKTKANTVLVTGGNTAVTSKTNIPSTATVVKKTDNRISRKKALELMSNNKGRFFTATFIKKDGTERTINCQYLKDQTEMNLGYIKVRESGKLKTSPNDCTRQINLQTLKSLKISGNLYKIRN